MSKMELKSLKILKHIQNTSVGKRITKISIQKPLEEKQCTITWYKLFIAIV